MTAVPILDRMVALSDLTRSRMLLVLEENELTVGELCLVLQLPQSTVSRHLKVLGDEGWVAARAEGTSRRYSIAGHIEPSAKRLWQIVREQVADTRTARQDASRVRSVLAERRTTSREFFSTAAGQWDRLRTELFGPRAELGALLALFNEAWVVGDLGCGTGQVAETIAPFVGRVIAVDESGAMLAAARKRLASYANVETRQGELDALPISDDELDVAMLSLVLHYVPDPPHVLAEVERVLRPSGRLLVVDMMPHDREEYRRTMGHVWQGFSAEQLEEWLRDAGFESFQYHPLTPDPIAMGPSLFAMSARKAAGATRHAAKV